VRRISELDITGNERKGICRAGHHASDLEDPSVFDVTESQSIERVITRLDEFRRLRRMSGNVGSPREEQDSSPGSNGSNASVARILASTRKI